MKKIITSILLFFLTILINAQNFQGQAIYSCKYKIDGENEKESKSSEDEVFKKTVHEAMLKASEVTFVLNFNRFESIYDQEKKLESPNNNADGDFVTVDFSDGGKKYKNLKTNKIIIESDILDKEYLIVDDLKKWDWKLSDETKKIGNYTCFKAEAIVPVTEEQKTEYQEQLKKQSNSKTNLFVSEEPKEIKVIAWYTTDIPVSQGPNSYWGLPGLILELKDENSTLLCTKVILNQKDKTPILAPKKGKIINQKDFDIAQKSAYEKMQESYQMIKRD